MPGFKPTPIRYPREESSLSFKAAAPPTPLPACPPSPSGTPAPAGSSPASRGLCPHSLGDNPIPPRLHYLFLSLARRTLRLGKWTRQMGKEVEILCNTIVCITKLVLSASPRDLLELV